MKFLQTQTLDSSSRVRPERNRAEKVQVDDIVCVNGDYCMLVEYVDKRRISGIRILDSVLVSVAFNRAVVESWHVVEQKGRLIGLIVEDPGLNLQTIADDQETIIGLAMHPGYRKEFRAIAFSLVQDESALFALAMHPDFDRDLVSAAFVRINDQLLKDRIAMTWFSSEPKPDPAYHNCGDGYRNVEEAISRATDVDLLLITLHQGGWNHRYSVLERIAKVKDVGLAGFSDKDATELRECITDSIDHEQHCQMSYRHEKNKKEQLKDSIAREDWLRRWL